VALHNRPYSSAQAPHLVALAVAANLSTRQHSHLPLPITSASISLSATWQHYSSYSRSRRGRSRRNRPRRSRHSHRHRHPLLYQSPTLTRHSLHSSPLASRHNCSYRTAIAAAGVHLPVSVSRTAEPLVPVALRLPVSRHSRTQRASCWQVFVLGALHCIGDRKRIILEPTARGFFNHRTFHQTSG
jgi:hypothetical protein